MLTVKDAAQALDLQLIAGAEGAQREIKDCYIGDLLSRVISRAKADGVWITIMTNVNVAAVALLADVACIVLAEGVTPDPPLREKCESEGIALLSTEKDAYTLAFKLHGML